ncbi:hypothetical protein FE257_012041 [Aspergillus nanangensis]|uniref:Zn(2)-C6 fungal-type domain-containing protein n=1 Tax=Aspergillus nanangensis TaxID=2582783 RepID=A0AAD4GR28_ASPNN|nr:hypothetical protein FE257_012041 [Aspergillus nanangensis]
MPPRRSHQKSHTGCITCKRRHVKCDETGPPCNRCETRGAACEYASLEGRRGGGGDRDVPIPDPKTTTTPPTDATTSPSFPTIHRHLDLQLMHRWATSTYHSCCTPGAGDQKLWQLTVPALALQHDFLLNGVLALAALESASVLKKDDDPQQSPHYDKYINAAMEYQALALADFRTKLASPPLEDPIAAICFSLMLMVLAFASVQFRRPSSGGSPEEEEESIVKSAIAHFDLVRGAVQVAESGGHEITQNEYVQNLTPFEDLPLVALDPSIADILTTLGELNDTRIVTTAQEGPERRFQEIALWEACKKALNLLQQCFHRCVGLVYRGYALGWLNLTGDGYIQALKLNDRTSLLILMVWGVLVEKLGHDVWWAHEFGSSLVDELAKNDLCTAVDDPSARDLIRRIQELI